MTNDLWKPCTLGEILLFSNGRTSPERSDEGNFDVFGSNGVIGRCGQYNAPADTIIIGRVGTYCGSVHYSKSPCWVTDNAIKANVRTGNCPRFAFYLLGQKDLNSLRGGSGQPLLNQTILSNIRTSVPDSAEQEAIASFLSSFDDRITLLRETNATLEAIAQALFKSWFVDFDPVRAKAEGREPEGVPPEVVDLFPDELVESELGMIPKGWGTGTIFDLADINAWILRKQDRLDVIKYIEISAVDRGNISEIVSYQRGDEPSRARRRLKHGDTVLSTVRPDRQAYFLALHPDPNLLASTGFAVVTPKSESWSFLHAALTRKEVFDTLGNLADGGAYPAVRPEVIGNLNLVIPPADLVAAYHQVANGLYEKCHHNRDNWHTLTELRDTLLPRLMSGKLRITEAEKELDAV